MSWTVKGVVALAEKKPAELVDIVIPDPGPHDVVVDIEAARAALVHHGLDIGPVQRFEGGEWIDGKGGDWNSFARFSDPDGNIWALQERPAGA